MQLVIKEDNELNERLELTLQARKDSKSLLQQKASNGALIKSSYSKVKSLIPKSMDIYSWIETSNQKSIILEKDTCLLEIYSNKEEFLFSITSYPNIRKIVTSNFSDFPSELESVLSENSNLMKIVYLPSTESFQKNLPLLKYKDKTISDFFEVRHIFKVSQFTRDTGFDFSRLKRVSSITNEKNKPISIKNSDSIVKKINIRSFSSNELKNYLLNLKLSAPI